MPRVELIVNEIASRIPLTLDRMLSSTKRATMASVNGIAPNTSSMKIVIAITISQPSA